MQKTDFLFPLIFFILSINSLSASENIPLYFTYPAFEGDFYVSGIISLPPSVFESGQNMLVRTADPGPDEEAASLINILQRWPDNSIMSAEVTFIANSSRKAEYVLAYGRDIIRKKTFAKTAVLPVVSFSAAGSPMAFENIDMNVGQINVRVDRSPGIYYYWHIIPIISLIIVSYLRSRRRAL